MLFETGRVCVKLAGRDAGKKCIVIDHVDAHTVLVDGETRRRKCNVKHLEPLDKVVALSKGAPAAEVQRVAKELGFVLPEKKGKKTGKKEAPKVTRVQKEKPIKPAKTAKAEPAAKPKHEKKE